jgi:hypothetical protein
MRKYAPLVAAGVNGALIIVGPPLVFLIFKGIEPFLPARYASNTVSASSPLASALISTLTLLPLTGFFAGIAVWRTLIHAMRWQNQQRSWWGVAEAAGAGALLTVVVMLPLVSIAAFTTGSLIGFAAIPVYAVIFGAVGTAFGLVFQLTAMLVMTLMAPRASVLVKPE